MAVSPAAPATRIATNQSEVLREGKIGDLLRGAAESGENGIDNNGLYRLN
jgi:hypothetical protein